MRCIHVKTMSEGRQNSWQVCDAHDNWSDWQAKALSQTNSLLRSRLGEERYQLWLSHGTQFLHSPFPRELESSKSLNLSIWRLRLPCQRPSPFCRVCKRSVRSSNMSCAVSQRTAGRITGRFPITLRLSTKRGSHAIWQDPPGACSCRNRRENPPTC